MSQCKYDCGWAGQCTKEANAGSLREMCHLHDHLRCASCGKPATRECDHTGIQFVCGAPLCGECSHAAPKRGEEGFCMLGGGHKPKAEAAASWIEYEGAK